MEAARTVENGEEEGQRLVASRGVATVCFDQHSDENSTYFLLVYLLHYGYHFLMI